MRHLSLLLALLFFTSTACDGGCGKKDATIPKKPVDRVQQMAGYLPKSTELAVFVSDIDSSQKSLNKVADRLGQEGMLDTATANIRNSIGIDPLDAESWKTAGIPTDSGFTVAYYRSRVIFLAYVENRQKFEKILTEKTKKSFGITAVVKSTKEGKHDMKVLSQDPARQIAWLYRGKLAVVVMPATTGQGALQDGSATSVLGTVADTTKETGLRSTKGWNSFVKRLATDYPISAYVNSAAYLASEEVKKEMAQDAAFETTVNWANKNVIFVGAGLKAEDDQARLDVFAATTKEFVEAAKKVRKSTKKYDWAGFATEHTLLGLRLTLDPKAAWNLALENMPEDERRAFQRRLGILGEQYNVDIEKDLIEKLSGNVGAFFYGVAGNPMVLLQADPNILASKAGLLVVLPFDKKESLDALIEKLIGPLGQLVSMRNAMIDGQEDPGLRVIELAMPTAPGRFYAYGDSLVFATTAFGDSAIKKYLDNKRGEKRLKDVAALNLGKSFASDDVFNGLYFNAGRANSNLGTLIAMGGLGDIMAQLEEAALTFDVEDSGVSASLTVDLSPNTAPQDGQDGGDEGQQQGEKKGDEAEGQK